MRVRGLGEEDVLVTNKHVRAHTHTHIRTQPSLKPAGVCTGALLLLFLTKPTATDGGREG